MTELMKDSFKHSGMYPFYTLAMTDKFTDLPSIPIVIRQYGENNIQVNTYPDLTSAYEAFKLFVGEEQPFIPVLDRTS